MRLGEPERAGDLVSHLVRAACAINIDHRQAVVFGLAADLSVPQLITGQPCREHPPRVSVTPVGAGPVWVGVSVPQRLFPERGGWQQEHGLAWPAEQRCDLAGKGAEVISNQHLPARMAEQVIQDEGERLPVQGGHLGEDPLRRAVQPALLGGHGEQRRVPGLLVRVHAGT